MFVSGLVALPGDDHIKRAWRYGFVFYDVATKLPYPRLTH